MKPNRQPTVALLAGLHLAGLGLSILTIMSGCSGRASVSEADGAGSAPLVVDVDGAFAAAKTVPLPEVAPIERTGLHNVFRLGDRVISGSEPEGEAAFKALADLGVRTIITVDGKAPDAKTASRHDMRYVHIPIRYRGITDSELLRLTKAFRELEGPFYVHCFHGRHRGPAAAAIGRLVLDGVERPVALAEMHQWCGTAKKYGGLYHDVATKPIPTETQTATFDWEFPTESALGGYRQVMTKVVRASDALKLLAKRDWKADPAHPDLDAANEADKLADYYERSQSVAGFEQKPESFRRWHRKSAEASRTLHGLLMQRRRGEAVDRAEIDRTFAVIGQNCKSCHTAFRNKR